MENFPYSSTYPDSGDSSPRSREIDTENQSWDEPPSNYKVKVMCSYGGKIQPRPHDNQLAYINGDTKILAVDRNIKLAAIMTKLSSICGDADVCFKYQLPGEDLDALISVTNDEDLEHMMLEYDRLHRGSTKPARLRLFLFPLNPGVVTGFGSNETKSERQWFVDALNSVQIPVLEGSSPPAAKATNPDFLFGLEKGFGTDPAAKIPDSAAAVATIPEVVTKDVSAAGSDCGSEDRAVTSADIQRQIQELQRLQIATGHEQGILQRKSDEINQRAYNENLNYYGQKVAEKVVAAAVAPQPVQVPVQMQIPAAYLPERHMTTAGYQMAAASGNEQPVYLFPAPAGMYQAPPALRPVTGPAGPAYYGVQRMVPEMYREQQPMYNAVAPGSIQQPKVVGGYSDGIGMVQQKPAVAEPGYVQVGYDGAGRQVYYTTAAPGGVVQQYQAMAVDGRQGGGALNQEGKVVVNAKGPQTSSV